jgi:hypothetical protein
MRDQIFFSRGKRAETYLLLYQHEACLMRGDCPQIMLFGGSGGIAAPAFGNVVKSFSRRSQNSEYLVFHEHVKPEHKQ